MGIKDDVHFVQFASGSIRAKSTISDCILLYSVKFCLYVYYMCKNRHAQLKAKLVHSRLSYIYCIVLLLEKYLRETQCVLTTSLIISSSSLSLAIKVVFLSELKILSAIGESLVYYTTRHNKNALLVFRGRNQNNTTLWL